MTGAKTADLLPREEYRAIKHMDKAQLTVYLRRLYRRGYGAGYDAGVAAERKRASSKQTPEATSAEG